MLHPQANRFGLAEVGGLGEDRDPARRTLGQGRQYPRRLVFAGIVHEEKVGIGVLLQVFREAVDPEPRGFIEARDDKNGFRHVLGDSTPGLEICLSNRTLWREPGGVRTG